jgi:arylsulfatase A-like enzyme
LDGKSFVSALRPQDEAAHTRILAWPKAVRDGDWKLVWQHPAKPELFNVGKDRNEMKNLVAEFPERVRKMKQIHAEIFRP